MSTRRLVAIVGRPNVGKSSLFNRFIGRRQAIVDDVPGLTRDRLYGSVDWGGRSFQLADTAGLLTSDSGLSEQDRRAGGLELAENTRGGTLLAIEEADVIIFLVDVRAGLTPLDQEVADLLRRGRVPVILAANKSESQRDPGYLHELYSLGFGEPIPISAINGNGTGDLLDRVVEVLPAAEEFEEEAERGKVAVCILGRTNVGKSSLLNAILGRPRSLVASIAGTTRDPVDTEVDVDGRHLVLVDTAGIRRKGVTKGGIEHYTVLRALRALERSDVAIIVIDASEGILSQDQHIAGYAADGGKGVVLVVNKWDLVPTEERDDAAWRMKLEKDFQFVPGVPIVYTSAKTGRRVGDVLPAALRVADSRSLRIPTPDLNRVVRSAVQAHPPPVRKSGRQLKVLYATQGKERAPTLVFFVNDPELIHFSYKRYLENQVREAFGFAGVPMKTLFRRRGEDISS